MLYALDTNTCVDLLRNNHQEMANKLKNARPSDFVLPSLVYAELLFGAALSMRPDENRGKINLFVAPFRLIDFNRAAATIYADIREKLQKSGTLIGPNDLIIAATAMAHGATLVTSNVKEFKRVQALRVENWRLK
jgi:tRNA(fMet)-specific endonuclease VapC